MNDAQRAEVVSLMVDWIDERCGYVGEFCGDVTGGYHGVIAQAKGRCDRIGLAWYDEVFIPDYVINAFQWEKGYQGDYS